ncbi:MAG TPA: amino acid permease, partial [Planctomycetaceae bacterium]|nr:amino acid permease [Planctomycetaceae bacterium]
MGTETGRRLIDAPFTLIQGDFIKWEQYQDGFDTLLVATAPLFWTFFLLTGLSLIILRYKAPQMERPFRVPLYPVTPILFCLTCH